MIKASTCRGCNAVFTYNTSTGSAGKFCTHPCFLKHRQKTAICHIEIRNGRKTAIYPIICINCGAAKDAFRKTAKYCSASCQLNYEYKNGRRDPIETSAAAHAAVKGREYPERRGKKIPWLHNEIVYAKVSRTKTGKPVPKLRGRNSGNWRGGVDKSVWKTPEYQAWRKAVMRRDNFTCTMCGDNRGGNLEADHIKPRYLFPELTFDITNGRTLCKSCHKQTLSWGAKVKKLSRDDFDLAA